MALSIAGPATNLDNIPATLSHRRFLDKLRWRVLLSFPVLLATLLAATVYAFVHRPIADPDIWWHLRNAELLVHHASMVRQDFYSFTTTGAPWINHEWLTELPYYFGWRWMGIRGLYLVLLTTVEAILMGVFCLAYYSSKNVKAAFLACWIAAFLATISFGPRTLLFGWIFLLAELFLLAQFKEGKDRLWLLPPLFLLWVNSHGSWLIGLVLLFLFVGSGLVEGTWGRIEASRWTRSRLRKLAMVCVFCVLVLFVNPYTYHLVFYPFDLAYGQKLNVASITEWRSLDFHELRGKIVFCMLATTIILGLARKRTWGLDEVAFLLLAFYSALTYSRFMFLAAIILTPLLAKELTFLPDYRPDIDKPWLNAILIACLVAACAWGFPSEKYLMQAIEKEYPEKALPYLQKFRPAGNVFTDYLWGGYLIWHTRQIPVFVDSRVDIFDHQGVFRDYLDAMGIRRPMEVFDNYHIRYVLHRKQTPLGYLLLHSAGWKVDYDDGTTILLERAGKTP